MDAATKQVLASVGARLRAARLENNMTQEVLAGPEFTKGYVSALERGAVRPSLKALDIFARRLNLPIAHFLSTRLDEDTSPERAQFEEDVIYQCNYARMLIRLGNTEEALQRLAVIESDAQGFVRKLPARVRYQLPYLRGLAYVQQGEYSRAHGEFESALSMIEKDGDAASIADVHNVLGSTFLQMNQPALALDQHLQCMQAVKANEVQDPNVRLSVYNNLAADYLALGETGKSVGTGKEASKSIDAAGDLQQQALSLWALADGYTRNGDWARAKTYATRALYIYDVADNKATAALIAMRLATAMISKGDLAGAEEELNKARELVAVAGDREIQSRLYLQYADLARHKGDLDLAADYAEQSVSLSDTRRKNVAAIAGQHAQDAAQTSYAEALYAAAVIAEKRGQQQETNRLFELAIDAIKQTSSGKTISQITFAYAQVLETRGDHKRAMEYYRQAAEVGAQ